MSPLSVSDVSSQSEANDDTPSVDNKKFLSKTEPTEIDVRMADLVERERKVKERENYLKSLEMKLMDVQVSGDNIQVSPIQRQASPELDEEPLSEVSMHWPEFGGTVKTIDSCNSPVDTEPVNHLSEYEKMVASLEVVDAAERTSSMS